MSTLKLYCELSKGLNIGYEEQIEQISKGGADGVVFNDVNLKTKEAIDICEKLKSICNNNLLFYIGSRADIALAVNADGLFIDCDDLPINWVRYILGRKTVGYYANSIVQALKAVKEGVNYLVVGPLFLNKKDSSDNIVEVDIIRIIKERVKVPVIAFGNIDIDNVSEVIKSGADGIFVSPILDIKESISDRISNLKQRLMELKDE